MSAPKGNQFWKSRSKHGRDKIFSDPDILWEAACEYFEWCDVNPWQKNEAVKAGPNFGDQVSADTQRPYSLGGLCIHLDIDDNTFIRYTKEPEYEDFWDVANKIKRVIETQQFEGATVGAFNANIIARKLGLADKKEVDVKEVTVDFSEE
ncbi:DNA-packaging protein [Ekhidna sp.]